MSSPREIVIVGGGVIGLSTAWYCLQRGYSVTVLERGADTRDCCSLGKCRDGRAEPLCPSRGAWNDLQGTAVDVQSGEPVFRSTAAQLGSDLVGMEILPGVNARAREARRSGTAGFEPAKPCVVRGTGHGRRIRVWIGEEGAAHVVQNRGDARGGSGDGRAGRSAWYRGQGAGGRRTGQSGSLNPNGRCRCGLLSRRTATFLRISSWRNLQDRVEAGGGKIVWEAEVERFVPEKGRVVAVQSSRGSHDAGEVVCAVGAWSPALARLLPGVRLPMQAGKGYSITVANPPALPGICSILCEAKVAVTPMAAGLRFGGTMEIAGSITRSIDAASRASSRRFRGTSRSSRKPIFRRSRFGAAFARARPTAFPTSAGAGPTRM